MLFPTGYKYELALCLSGALPLPDHTHYQQIEKKLFSDLNAESAAGKSTRNCFNYLLIDPRISRLISTKVGDLDKFRLFIEAIFYIGKGQKDRPLQHLVDAKESQVNAPNKVSVHTIQTHTLLHCPLLYRLDPASFREYWTFGSRAMGWCHCTASIAH